MPAQRPSAAFDPIPPDLDLARLAEETLNLKDVTAILYNIIDKHGMESLHLPVQLHLILNGKPLVIERFNNHLDITSFINDN